MAGSSVRVTPVARLRDQVYERLRQELIDGAFRPGQRLVELDLAARYGVSRTPVREAMARLQREGLLDAVERGYQLPLDPQRDVLDRLEVRRLLDAQIAARAARLADDGQIAALRQLFLREQAAHHGRRARKFVDAHLAFRDALKAMSRNALLVRCADMVDDSFQLTRNQLHEEPDNRVLTLACDEAVLAAIERRDPAAAEAAIGRFIDALLAYFARD